MPLLLSFSIELMHHWGWVLIINSEDYRPLLSQRRGLTALLRSGVIQQHCHSLPVSEIHICSLFCFSQLSHSVMLCHPPPPPSEPPSHFFFLPSLPSWHFSCPLSLSHAFISFMLSESSRFSLTLLTLTRLQGPLALSLPILKLTSSLQTVMALVVN